MLPSFPSSSSVNELEWTQDTPPSPRSTVSFLTTASSISPESSVSQTTGNREADLPKEAPGRWRDYFESRRGTYKGKRVWRWHCIQPSCSASYVQGRGAGGGSLTYHMSHHHRDAFLVVTDKDSKKQHSKEDELDYNALRWIIADFMPFSTFDSVAFRKFFSISCPMSKPLCSATLRGKLVLYREQLAGQVRDLMDRTMVYGGITLDSWISPSYKSYLGVTLQWLDQDFNCLECALGLVPQPFPRTAANTTRLVRSILGSEKWGIQTSIVSATTDSANVTINTVEMLGLTCYPCIAHSLHNSVEKAFESCEELQHLKTKCHNLAIYFQDSFDLVVELDVVTRWNSTLRMFQSLVEFRMPLDSLIFSAEQDPMDKYASSRLRGLRLTSSEWLQVEQLIEILKPFEDMTLIFNSSSAGLAACVAPWLVGLVIVLEDMDDMESDLMVSFRHALIREVKQRVVITDEYLVASALHPSFNTLWFIHNKERFHRIKDIIRKEFLKAAQVTPLHPKPETQADRGAGSGITMLERLLKRRRDQMESNGSSDDEVNRFFREDLKCRLVDPLTWWRGNRVAYPVLSILARKYLAMPASSVAPDRMFSFSGNVITDQRTHFSDDTVGDIVCSNYALKCLQMAKQFGPK